MIVLYTKNSCPKCKVLKSKLDASDASYTHFEASDTNPLPDDIMTVFEKHNFDFFPVLNVNEQWFNYYDALRWVSENIIPKK